MIKNEEKQEEIERKKFQAEQEAEQRRYAME
jgi:hypothetical protein